MEPLGGGKILVQERLGKISTVQDLFELKYVTSFFCFILDIRFFPKTNWLFSHFARDLSEFKQINSILFIQKIPENKRFSNLSGE